jgi:hypothetical protein
VRHLFGGRLTPRLEQAVSGQRQCAASALPAEALASHWTRVRAAAQLQR